MYFQPLRYEQATSEALSRYKATRAVAGPIADLCCGIGGDLLGLATRYPVTGVDTDPTCCLFARANANVYHLTNVALRCADACDFPIDEFACWHLDPDRRPQNRRTIDVAAMQPPLSEMEALLQLNPHGAIKLAPAAVAPERWQEQAELCWLGEQRECKQLLACFGKWAKLPGTRSAILVAEDGQLAGSWTGEADAAVPLCQHPLDYIIEPHSAIRAAGLSAAVASERGWQQLASGVRYFTAREPCVEAGMRCCRLVEHLPYDRKRVKALLTTRGMGRLEIKTHRARIDPVEEGRRLKVAGHQQATLFIYPRQNRLQCLVTTNVS